MITNKKSIKTTVFLMFGGLTALMFLFYAGLSIIIAFAVEDEVINQLLVTEANYLREEHNKRIQSNAKLTQAITPRIYYMQVYNNLAAMPLEFSSVIKKRSGEKEIFTDSQEHFHYRIITLSNGKKLYLVAEVSPFLVVSNLSDDILLVTSFVLMLMLALSLWFAYRVSLRTVLPVVKLSYAVKLKQLNEKTNTAVKPLPYLDSQDEIGYLAQSLESSLTQLNNALKREANFSRDLGHELRTPLTIIRNTLALREAGALSDSDRNCLQQQTDHLKNIIDVLMSLARAESIKRETLSLRSQCEESVLLMHAKCEEQAFSVVLDVADDIVVEANPQLLTLLVSNLLENALRYAASPQIIISAKNSRIIFENKVEKEPNQTILNRAVKQDDSTGIGQGLYLVQRIAEAMGWQCLIESGEIPKADEKLFKFVLITNVNNTAGFSKE